VTGWYADSFCHQQPKPEPFSVCTHFANQSISANVSGIAEVVDFET
jgi:hypothetical protein